MRFEIQATDPEGGERKYYLERSPDFQSRNWNRSL